MLDPLVAGDLRSIVLLIMRHTQCRLQAVLHSNITDQARFAVLAHAHTHANTRTPVTHQSISIET